MDTKRVAGRGNLANARGRRSFPTTGKRAALREKQRTDSVPYVGVLVLTFLLSPRLNMAFGSACVRFIFIFRRGNVEAPKWNFYGATAHFNASMVLKITRVTAAHLE